MIFELGAPGPVHMVRDSRCDKGARYTVVRCGVTIVDEANTVPAEWTVWESRVTCVMCRSSHG